MMKLMPKLKSVFESMIIAWIWLFLLIIHIIFFSNEEPTNIFAIIFDRFMFVTCFLLYPFSLKGSLENSIWPFFIQFVFWWIFGIFTFWLYDKLAKKKV